MKELVPQTLIRVIKNIFLLKKRQFRIALINHFTLT